MPSFCAVLSCNDRYGHAESISFHKFPFKRKELLQKWLEFAQRGNDWQPSKWSAICSRHFQEDDFSGVNERKTLKKTAVPSLRPEENSTEAHPLRKESKIKVLTKGKKEKTPKETLTKKEGNSRNDENKIQKKSTDTQLLEDEPEGVEEEITTCAHQSPLKNVKADCRLCGQLSAAVVTFANNFEIYGMLQKCFPTFNIQQDDNLPKEVCRVCLQRLESFSRFVDKVLETQSELRQRFRKHEEQRYQKNVTGGTSSVSAGTEKLLKIKQEPVVRVKQEVAENYNSFLSGDDMMDMGADELGCEADHDSTEEDQKFQFCSGDFPMLNPQDIINNCDIMEIINLDDPFIDIPDDDGNTTCTEGVRPLNLATIPPAKLQQLRLPSAHELLQSHLLSEEHNYAYATEDFKEEWQLKNFYKTEKLEGNEPLGREELVADDVGVDPLATLPLPHDNRSSRPIVTSISDLAETSCLPCTSSSKDTPPKSKPNIVVLNESIVKSSPAFRLYACGICQLKFFSMESLNQHYIVVHGQQPPIPQPLATSLEQQQQQQPINHALTSNRREQNQENDSAIDSVGSKNQQNIVEQQKQQEQQQHTLVVPEQTQQQHQQEISGNSQCLLQMPQQQPQQQPPSIHPHDLQQQQLEQPQQTKKSQEQQRRLLPTLKGSPQYTLISQLEPNQLEQQQLQNLNHSHDQQTQQQQQQQQTLQDRHILKNYQHNYLDIPQQRQQQQHYHQQHPPQQQQPQQHCSSSTLPNQLSFNHEQRTLPMVSVPSANILALSSRGQQPTTTTLARAPTIPPLQSSQDYTQKEQQNGEASSNLLSTEQQQTVSWAQPRQQQHLLTQHSHNSVNSPSYNLSPLNILQMPQTYANHQLPPQKREQQIYYYNSAALSQPQTQPQTHTQQQQITTFASNNNNESPQSLLANAEVRTNMLQQQQQPQNATIQMQQQLPQQQAEEPASSHLSKLDQKAIKKRTSPRKSCQKVATKKWLPQGHAANASNPKHTLSHYKQLSRRYAQLQRYCKQLRQRQQQQSQQPKQSIAASAIVAQVGTKKTTKIPKVLKFICRLCGERFASIPLLWRHKQTTATHCIRKSKHFAATCCGCGRFFCTRLALRNHMRYICQSLPLRCLRTRIQIFKCRYCRNITFTHWRLYRRHELKCQLKQRRGQKPERHYGRHKVDNKSCEHNKWASKRDFALESLQQRKKEHKGSRQQSKRSRKERQRARDYKKRRTYQRRGRFSSCSKGRRRRYSSRSNASSSGRSSAEDERALGIHRCVLCPCLFRRSSELRQHMQSFHLQLKPYTCATCRRAFALKCDMLRCGMLHAVEGKKTQREPGGITMHSL